MKIRALFLSSPFSPLPSGCLPPAPVAQVERHTEDEVRERYLQMKAKYIDPWDKVFTDNIESLLLP